MKSRFVSEHAQSLEGDRFERIGAGIQQVNLFTGMVDYFF